ELTRDEALGLETVGVGRDVDDLREPRVGDRAVVALEEVLADDLPVRLDVELAAEAELEAVEVEAQACEELRERAQRVGERACIGVGVDEHERAPGVDLEAGEAELVVVEAGLELGARGGSQTAVEAVRPRVVGALESLAAPLAARDRKAAVPAH